jgi:hypothetical protein
MVRMVSSGMRIHDCSSMSIHALCTCQHLARSAPTRSSFNDMNQSVREELFNTLAELSTIFPDWRFGQLIANLATAARGVHIEAIWDSEDEELLAAARHLLESNRDRTPART